MARGWLAIPEPADPDRGAGLGRVGRWDDPHACCRSGLATLRWALPDGDPPVARRDVQQTLLGETQVGAVHRRIGRTRRRPA